MKRITAYAVALMITLGAVMMCSCNSGREESDEKAGETSEVITTSPQEEMSSEETGDDQENGEAVIADEEVPLSVGPDSGETGDHPFVLQVIDLVNEERAKAGLAPLAKDDRLCGAASVRAKEIVSTFSHTRPDGSAYKTVLDQNGITYSACGENVASGYRTPEDVVAGWMASEGHRENILFEKFDSIGVGYYKDSSGQAYWVQLFMLKK